MKKVNYHHSRVSPGPLFIYFFYIDRPSWIGIQAPREQGGANTPRLSVPTAVALPPLEEGCWLLGAKGG